MDLKNKWRCSQCNTTNPIDMPRCSYCSAQAPVTLNSEGDREATKKKIEGNLAARLHTIIEKATPFQKNKIYRFMEDNII